MVKVTWNQKKSFGPFTKNFLVPSQWLLHQKNKTTKIMILGYPYFAFNLDYSYKFYITSFLIL